MYARCPSIAKVFQKAILVRDTKCNKIIQRQLHSESLGKLSKIESKLKPMKRCFSGASNNKNSMTNPKNMRAIGLIRKNFANVPHLPGQMLQLKQPSMFQQVAPSQIQCPAVSVNFNPSNDQPVSGGKITIVIDKNEIDNCSAQNENVNILVTTTKGLIDALSEADIAQICSTKCRSCQQCEKERQLKSQKIFPQIAVTYSHPRSEVNLSNLMKPQQNLELGNGRSLQMEPFNLNESLRMVTENREMATPDSHQMQPNVKQPPMKVYESPAIQDKRFQSTSSHLGSYTQPSALPLSMGPNIRLMDRHFSFHGLPPQNSILKPISSRLQKREVGAMFQKFGRQMHFKPVNVIEQEQLIRKMRMNPINVQQRKFSSLQKNEIPAKPALKNVDIKKIVLPRNAAEVGRSGTNPSQQPKHITERVIRPATFSSTNGLKEIAEMQREMSKTGPFVKTSSLFNTPKPVPKNKYAEGRGNMPRVLSFQNQSSLKPLQRPLSDNVLKSIELSGMRNRLSSPKAINQANVILKNNLTIPQSQPPQMQRAVPMSQTKSLVTPSTISQTPFSVPSQPPPALLKKRFQQNQIQNRQQPNNFASQRPQIISSPKQRSPVQKLPQLIRNISLRRELPQKSVIGRKHNLFNRQQVSTKNRFPKGQENRLEMLPLQTQNRMYPVQSNVRKMPSMSPQRINIQPPQIVLKQRSRPSRLPQSTLQPLQRRRTSPIPVAQRRGRTQRNAITPNNSTTNTTRLATAIPVRRNFDGQNILPQQNVSVWSNKTPTVPLQRLVYPTQMKTVQRANGKSLMGLSKERKLARMDQLQKRSNIRRTNVAKFQPPPSSIILRQPSLKYVKRPMPMQGVRPYPNQMNLNPRGPDVIPVAPIRQVTAPMNGGMSLAQDQPTKPVQLKETPNTKVLAPKVDNSELNYKNPAILFYGPGKLKLVDIAVPRLADDNGVVVKMLYVHLTETDAQMLSCVRDGPYKLTEPTIAGKSGSGLVVDAGKKVDNVKIGDEVSVKGMSCGKCTACDSDYQIMCEGISNADKFGILKRFLALPANCVTKLPDKVNPIDGAMIDELSSAIRACQKSTVTAGDNVLVLGGKSLGLWTALAAKSMGATTVCVADSRPLVLDQAKKLGINRLFLINLDSPVADTSKKIAEYMEEENPRIVFDCNGSSLTNQIAINTTTVGGKVVLMKNSVANHPIVLTDAVERGIDILSSQHGNKDSERAALSFLASGKVKLNDIDSVFFDIFNVHEAFALLTTGTISNIFIRPGQLDDKNNANTKSKTL